MNVTMNSLVKDFKKLSDAVVFSFPVLTSLTTFIIIISICRPLA